MNDGLIPQRYAKALYKLALEHGDSTKLYDAMKLGAASFVANPDLQKTLANPFVSREDKQSLLLAAVGPDVDKDYQSFVRLVLDHGRENFAHRMMLDYQKIYRRANNISQVEIITAKNMPEDKIRRIKDLISGSFPGRSFEYTLKIDPKIVGGFVIDVDSVRMDASISNGIEQLRQKLLSSN